MTRLVWQAGMAVGLSEFCEPAGITTFGYEATTAGIAGTHEPTWPLTAGTTVVDGTITWTARAATTITWTARALYKTGSTEPTWPTTVGATVTDNNITWTTITPAITDSKCPQSPIAFAIQHKIYSPDADVTRYCSTDNPRDWSTQDDAGFISSGLNSPSSPYVTAIGEYRGRLAIWTAGGLQIWTPDPDPANIALFDTIDGIGTSYSRSHASVAGDLYFLSHAGVRSLSIAAGANTLESGDVGAPIDSIVKAMAAAGDDAIGSYYPGFGQYWLTFTPARPAISGSFPDTCDDVDYIATLTISGGSGVYVQASFMSDSSTYPPGTSLNIVDNQLTVEFFNAPAGTYRFPVSVTDSLGIKSLPIECVIVVHDFTIVGALPAGVVGVAYSQSVAFSDGIAPFSAVITSGALPTGGTMTVVGSNLVFAWPNTVTAATYTFAGHGTDATGCLAPFSYSVVMAADVKPLYTRLMSVSHTYRGSTYAALAAGTPATTPTPRNEVPGQYASNGIYCIDDVTGSVWHAFKGDGAYGFNELTITGTKYGQVVGISPNSLWLVSCLGSQVGATSTLNYYVYAWDGTGYTLNSGPYTTTGTFSYLNSRRLVFSPDGTKVAHAIAGTRVYVHAFSAGVLTIGSYKTTASSENIDWRPDSTYIAGVSSQPLNGNGVALVFNASTLATVGSTVGAATGNRHGLSWDASGNHLYTSGSYDGVVVGVSHFTFSTSTGLAWVANTATPAGDIQGLVSTLDVVSTYLAAASYGSGLVYTYKVESDGSLTYQQSLAASGRSAWWVNGDLV